MLRDLEEDAKQEVVDALEDAANRTVKDAASLIPRSRQRSQFKRVKSGKKKGSFRSINRVHLRDVIGKKFTRDKLEVGVGFSKSIIGKKAWEEAGWRAHFFLRGTKGGVIRKGPFKGTVFRGQRANPVLDKAQMANKDFFIQRTARAVREAIRKHDRR